MAEQIPIGFEVVAGATTLLCDGYDVDDGGTLLTDAVDVKSLYEGAYDYNPTIYITGQAIIKQLSHRELISVRK